ncbi:TIGR04388 family protein (plasmid) [Leptospira weilii]|nr:TIGR04388 family protein [Leptospira weilii]
MRVLLFLTFVFFNLLTGAESPVSEKGKRISNIEYNRTLKYERYFLRKPPSFLTPKPYPLTPKTYVAAVAITATNAGMQAYVAGETGGGNNGAIAGVANAAISTITAGAGSAFTGYVSWTPHRAGNLFTGEDAVSGGWGGGLSGSFQGTSGLLKGVGLNGGLSFQPGSGVGVNMNVNLPGSTGLPRGSFLGINYQTGSGAYTASGGFSLYQNGNSSTGISLSASNSGYANVGLNYNKDGNSFLNRLQGYSLNIGSDGLLSLHNQFRGADVLSLGYNFNTHSFDPIGINQNFQNDYNNSVTQENAAANAAASAEKLAEKRQEWLDAQRTKPGYEGLSDQAVFDKYKLENSGVGGSRLDLPSQVFGSLGDMFGGSLGLFNSSGEGYLNSQGEFVPRTCFTAGTLVHTSQGTKKIEEIQVGDIVASFNEQKEEFEYNRVVETYVRQTNKIYKLTYENGRLIETTNTHPFYIARKGWVEAEKLQVGDRSVLSNENTLMIVSIEIDAREKTVYNFQVENAHTYFVTEEGVLVHNADYEGTDKGEAHAQLEAILNGDTGTVGAARDMLSKITDAFKETFKKFKTSIGQAGDALDAGFVAYDVTKVKDIKTGFMEDMLTRELDSVTRDYDAKKVNTEKLILERKAFLNSAEGAPYVLDPTPDLVDGNLNDQYKQHNENIENQKRLLFREEFMLKIDQMNKQMELSKLNEILNYKKSGDLVKMEKSFSEYVSGYRKTDLKLEYQSMKPVLLQLDHAVIIKAGGGDPDFAKAKEAYEAYLNKREEVLKEQKAQKCYTSSFGGVSYSSCR